MPVRPRAPPLPHGLTQMTATVNCSVAAEAARGLWRRQLDRYKYTMALKILEDRRAPETLFFRQEKSFQDLLVRREEE